MEPRFLDDESLVDNLDDGLAKKVIDWLITIQNNDPEYLEKAINLVRELNSIGETNPDYTIQIVSQMEKNGTKI